MLVKNDNKIIMDNKDKDNINKPFSTFIKCLSKIDKVIYDELTNNNILSIALQYTDNIILTYCNKNIALNNNNNIITKMKKREFQFILKIYGLKKMKYTYKKYNDSKQLILFQFFIAFYYNIFRHYLIIKTNNDSISKQNIFILYNLLKKILAISGKLYLDKNINDDRFEILLKLLLIFSISNSIDKEPYVKEEIINLMFFKVCINLVKIIFNNLYEIQKEFTQRQEELLNNIILFIKNNILCSKEKEDRISYLNKHILSRYDFKTSLLIDLSFIISKTKSKELYVNLISLLTDIYSFSFKYENLMCPILQQTGLLISNINRKKFDKLIEEINASDFPISLIDSLINKEKEILEEKPCLLRSGIYFGSNISGLSCDINSLESEFIIIFGFKMESNDEEENTLFQIVNNKDKTPQIRCYLRRKFIENGKSKVYEMFIKDKKESQEYIEIRVSYEKNYIFSFHFKMGGIRQPSIIKANFIKDDNNPNWKRYKPDPKNGKEFKTKNLKNENITIYFGSELDTKSGKIVNKFRGFIGDIIILNSKHLKDSGNSSKSKDISKILLHLERQYKDIPSIFGEKVEDNIFINKNFRQNKNYTDLINEIHCYEKNEKNIFESIKLVINPNTFKLFNYKEEIDFIKSNDNFEYKNLKTGIKKKYLEFRAKPDNLESDKIININTSFFDKNYHIFENKSTLVEFVKFNGVHFLSLLMEYYYQILCHLNENKNEFKGNEITDICQKINQKILKILEFFDKNIFGKILNIHYNILNKFFYMVASTLLNLLETSVLKFEIIKCLINMMNYKYYEEEIYNPFNDNIKTIKANIFEFLLNPKLYQKKDDNEEYLQTLKFVMENLLNNLKNNSNEYHKKLFNLNILNKLLSFVWLLDDNNNEKNNINNGNNKNKNLIETIRKIYTKILKEFLKYYSKNIKNYISKDTKALSNPSLIQIKKENDNKQDLKSQKGNKEKDKNKIEENNKEELNLFDYYINIALKNKRSQYLFLNMMIILFKNNLVNKLNNSSIEKIKLLIKKELRNDDDKLKEYKKIIFLSCLIILIGFHFSGDTKLNKAKKIKDFNSFIKNLYITQEFFQSLISSMKLIKYLSNNSDNLTSFDDEDLVLITDDKYEMMEVKTITEKNINEKEKEDNETNEIFYTFTSLPLKEINIKDLNDLQISIIKNILEDVVFLLFNKILIKMKNKEKNEENLDKEIFDTLKKNIDIIFKFNGTQIYQEVFSSENNICAELFYLKWSLEMIEGGSNNTEKEVKNYHKELFRHHYNPFIFKFYFCISTNNISSMESIIDISEDKINKTKLSLLYFIVKTLYEFKKENNIFYINNLLNYVILLNEEIDSNSNVLKGKAFLEIFYKFIELLDRSCLLYSNYYIGTKNSGKIISEIILDIFFSFSDYLDKFRETFTKENQKEETILSIFYLIDICTNDNFDENIKEEAKQYIYNIDNLLYIHKNFFNQKKKPKLFLGKKLYQIKKVNFSIYFLAKCFIYLNKKQLNNKFKNFLNDIFLKLIIENIYRLFTKRSKFYGKKTCKEFPLYYLTKSFIESNIIQDPTNFRIISNFFKNDIMVDLKEEYNIGYCYSSRLIHEFQIPTESIKRTSIQDKDLNNSVNLSLSENSDNPTRTTSANTLSTVYTQTFNYIKDVKNAVNFFNLEEDINNNDKSLELPEDKVEKEYFSSFTLINKENIIYNPKNYFLKIIFSEAYKNIVFNDNTFKLIRATYLTKFRNYIDINKESKQINYPTKQKNYSNSLEPKIFLQRDFNFYDKVFFRVSHSYIKEEVLNKYLKNIIFYPHKYNLKEQNYNLISFFCELVTQQYVYFGKMYFFENFIFFETEKDDPRINEKEDILNIFKNFQISIFSDDNKTSKKKSILIFKEDIKEIIKRRTLYTNQSAEIFHKNGKSYFFNFFTLNNFENVYKYFEDFVKYKNEKDGIKQLVNKYQKGQKLNYDFLLALNKYSSRTYNDVTQYPVFPWLTLEHNKIQDILILLDDKDKNQIQNYLRDLKYPISMQTEEKRTSAKMNFDMEKNQAKYPSHLGTHYSTSAYIFFYLLRLNPYGQSLIKLQNYQYDHPNRLFNSFKEIEEILLSGNDNRELIPDFFCYFDFLCNLNCCFYGARSNKEIIDDFHIFFDISKKYNNVITSYAYFLYNIKKLLNNNYISKILKYWIDNIFGIKQIPKKQSDLEESCNMYNKLCYEQRMNFGNKIDKYINRFENKKEINEKEFIEKVEKLRGNISFVINFGMCPKQILTESISYEGKPKSVEYINKVNSTNTDKYIYFSRITKENDNFLLLKDEKSGKTKSRMAAIYTSKNFKENEFNTYDCTSMNLMRQKIPINDNKSFLYKPNYSISFMTLCLNKTVIPIVISCRYLENYFRIQNNDKIINVFYEDFVTCIMARNFENSGDDIFYTGLINGKLTEWKIIPSIDYSNKNNKNNKKDKNKTYYNFKINELKNVYAHKSSITAIELYHKQNIIITSGEDKFVYIRKIFDFELLTVIDLTYSFGNPIVSETANVFPSMIKVSKLNLLYILLYDYDNKINFIRGYNLNGLFFAQTDPKICRDNKSIIQFNNISFSKNSNLVVGSYNSDKIYILESYDLKLIYVKEIKNKNKSKAPGNKMVEYYESLGEFYVLYDNEVNISTFKDEEEQNLFESF